jgi:hypothetical protein
MESTELTVAQCRVIAAVRAKSPNADVVVHRSRSGVILEVRSGRRVQLARLDVFGRIRHDRNVRDALRRLAPVQGETPQAA